MKILVIDVGGSHVKIMVSGSKTERRMDSGPTLTAAQMTAGVRALAKGWKYDHVSIGFPGVVVRDHPAKEPVNLGSGWVGYDFEKAFGCPVRMINDAAMQALGGYEGGKMLFLGFGTGLGTAMIVDGVVVPMEAGHLPYKRATFENYVGEHALERDGKKKWRRSVADVIARLSAALQPEDILLGGGNIRYIKELPANCRFGANADAFPGGFRLWTGEWVPRPGRGAPAAAKAGAAKRKATRRRPAKALKKAAKSAGRTRAGKPARKTAGKRR